MPQPGWGNSPHTHSAASTQIPILHPKICCTTRIAIASKSQCYTYHSPKWLALNGRTYIGCHRRGSQISCQPCKTISGSTNLRELPSFCLPSQARTPTPHERKIPAEDWSSCMCSRARALARAQNSDWLNSQVSPPRSPFHIMKVKGCWASDSFQLYL